MSAVIFIDTSVLCNLVPVPGRDQHADEVKSELVAHLDAGRVFILPITAVIETGNFIAQISDGRARRKAAQDFENILRYVCEGKAPWTLHDVAWTASFIEEMLRGAGTGSDYVQHAQNKVGAGDLCILTERFQYQNRTQGRAEIWTRDVALGAHG